MKIKKIILCVVALGLLVSVPYVYSIKFRISDEEVMRQIADEHTKVTIDYHDYEDRSIRNILVETGNDDLLILLHGSPSSSGQWVPLVRDSVLSSKVDFLMIDRPGYGYSDFGNPILSVEGEAEIVHEITLRHETKYERIFVFGTSYGGTVAARLMMDYPQFLNGGVLVASSMAPGEEFTYDISYAMASIPWLFPEILNIASKEKLTHYRELKKMEPLWSKIKNRLLFIHSTTDDLIYPANVDFAIERLNPEVRYDTVWVPNGEHSLFWSDRELLKRELNQFLDSFKEKIKQVGENNVLGSKE